MIKLYHSAGARSFRALWALEELSLPYELVMLRPLARSQYPNYLDINPLGTVPLMLVDGRRMTESAAIPHVLGCRFGPTDLVVDPQEPEYPDYMNFLVMGEATLTFPQTIYLRYTRLEPGKDGTAQAATDYANWFRARLRAAETLMGSGGFVCAGRFTMADITVSYAVQLANVIGLRDMVSPQMQDYVAALQQRDGYKRAVAAQTAAPVISLADAETELSVR
jgi:glutathione S-transferase